MVCLLLDVIESSLISNTLKEAKFSVRKISKVIRSATLSQVTSTVILVSSREPTNWSDDGRGIQRTGDALLHEMHISSESMMRHQSHAHTVALPSLGTFMQCSQSLQQIGCPLLKRTALETSLRGVLRVDQWKTRQIP